MMASHFILNCGGFSSYGPINQCSGCTSVEDVTRVQDVQHLEKKLQFMLSLDNQSRAKHSYHQWLPLQAELSCHLLTTVRLVEWFQMWSTLQEPNPDSCSSQTCIHTKSLRAPKPTEMRDFPRLMSVCRGTARDPVTSHACDSGFMSPSHFLNGSGYNNCCTGYLLIACCNLIDIQAIISASRRTHIVWLSSDLIMFWICCCHSPASFV